MQNKIIVLSGPSGVGKSTIQNFLSDSCEVFIPVCVTTRTKRNDEDCDYIFTDEETWKEYEKQGKYFFTTGNKDKYGFVLDEQEKRPYLIATSYKNAARISQEHPNTSIIMLTYSNMAFEMPKRVVSRDGAEAPLSNRIKHARDDHFNCFSEVLAQSEFLLYTDLYSEQEVNEIVCDYLVTNNLVKVKKHKLLSKGNK